MSGKNVRSTPLPG